MFGKNTLHPLEKGCSNDCSFQDGREASSFLHFPQEREGPGVEEAELLCLAACAGGVLESCCYLEIVLWLEPLLPNKCMGIRAGGRAVLCWLGKGLDLQPCCTKSFHILVVMELQQICVK